MTPGSAIVIQGDARSLPLPDDSVDLLVTSPPYFALRKYSTDDSPLEIGSEETWQEWLANLVDCTREWARVLKPSGSMFVDCGDKYVAHPRGERDAPSLNSERETQEYRSGMGQNPYGLPRKSLMLLPERYRIACVDELGLIARAVIVWSKPNSLPEAVVDRVRRSHEDWVHLTLKPRYYSAVDEIRVAQMFPFQKRTHGKRDGSRGDTGRQGERCDSEVSNNPLGALPGSVWSIKEDLWDHVLSGPMRFCPRCGRDLTAGSSSAITIQTGTPPNTSPESASAERADLSTKNSSVPSPTDSPSTTSAETSGVSVPTTSSPSPSTKTSGDETSPTAVTTARVDTHTRPRTPTSEGTGGGSAACVCELGLPPIGLGSVWPVPTEPLRVPEWLGIDHFAAFPTEWPRRLILGWSPPGVCTECGAGRRPVVDKCHTHLATRSDESMAHRALEPLARTRMHDQTTSVTATITGYACACPTPDAPTTPSVVLDPFSGTGTTIAVARALGRIGIGVDLSHDYNRLAQWRVNDPALRAKVQGRAWQERQGVLL